jgi:hypothetical protein
LAEDHTGNPHRCRSTSEQLLAAAVNTIVRHFKLPLLRCASLRSMAVAVVTPPFSSCSTSIVLPTRHCSQRVHAHMTGLCLPLLDLLMTRFVGVAIRTNLSLTCGHVRACVRAPVSACMSAWARIRTSMCKRSMIVYSADRHIGRVAALAFY